MNLLFLQLLSALLNFIFDFLTASFLHMGALFSNIVLVKRATIASVDF